MKHLKLKSFFLALLLTCGVGQMWAYQNLYLVGAYTGGNWGSNQTNYQLTGSLATGKSFIAVYHNGASTNYFKLYTNNTIGPNSDNNAELTTSGEQAQYSKGSAWYINNSKKGIYWICADQTGDGREWNPWVWQGRAPVRLKHEWTTDETWEYNNADMDDNEDGTYVKNIAYPNYDDAGYNYSAYHSNGSYDVGYITSPTINGEPSAGDLCEFYLNTNSTPSLTITLLCTITYDDNNKTSGSVPSDDTEKKYDVAYTTATNSGSLTRTGYDLTGWNTRADGLGTHVDLGGSFTPQQKNETLYAEWTPKTTTVTLNKNTPDGKAVSGPASIIATYDAELPTFTALSCTGGYALTGYWDDDEGGNKIINADGSFNGNSGIWNRTDGSGLTLYAQWSLSRTLTYDGNTNTSGDVPASATEYDDGEEVTVLGNVAASPLVKTGYTFNGWNTAGNGTGDGFAAGEAITMDANYTLYAQWSEIKHDVTINNGSGDSKVGITTTATATATAAAAGKKFKTWEISGTYTITSGSLTTRSITINATTDVTLTATYEDRASVKLYFAKPSGWTNVYAYAWQEASKVNNDPTNKNAKWHGLDITSNTEVVKGVTYHYYTYYTDNNNEGSDSTALAVRDKIIFNDGSSNETATFNISNGHFYHIGDGASSTGSASGCDWYLRGTWESTGAWDYSKSFDGWTENVASILVDELTESTKQEFMIYRASTNQYFKYIGDYDEYNGEYAALVGSAMTLKVIGALGGSNTGNNAFTSATDSYYFTLNISTPAAPVLTVTPGTDTDYSATASLYAGSPEGCSISTSGAITLHQYTPTLITATPAPGYRFKQWNVSGCSVANATANPGSFTATANSGTITAEFTNTGFIYFDNSMTQWQGDIYVYFFTSPNTGWLESATDGKGPGVVPVDASHSGKMTRIGSSNIYYYDYSGNWTPGTNVAFTKGDRNGYHFVQNGSYAHLNNFNTCAPMYVASSTWQEYNYSGNHKNGYWKRYNVTNSGFALRGLVDNNSNGNKWDAEDEIEFTATSRNSNTFKATVTLNAATHSFKIYRCAGDPLGNSGKMTPSNHSGWEMTPGANNCQIEIPSGGSYEFTLNLGSDHIYLSVEYPLLENDYQVLYIGRITTGGSDSHRHASQSIRHLMTASSTQKDTVSFFIDKDHKGTMKMQYCTNPVSNSGKGAWSDVDPAVTVDLSGITETGIYNIEVVQTTDAENARTVTASVLSGKYMGDLYIRTDVARGGWEAYKDVADNKLIFSDYAKAHSGYDYYHCHWAPTGANLHFTIANRFSPSISDTMTTGPASPFDFENLPYQASVRFMYNSATNAISRAYLNGSSEVGVATYLVLQASGDSIKKADGSALIRDTDSDGLRDTVFYDNNNWVYQVELQALEGTHVRLISNYWFNSERHPQYFKGSTGDWNGSTTTELVGGSGGTWQKLRLVYDFKTNHLISAWLPNGTITGDLAINADIMLIRQNQDAATQLAFNSNDIALSKVNNVYGVLELTKTHLVPTVDPGNTTSRSLYWISFPFDVKVSDIFGFGNYGDAFIVRKYNGAKRAEKGWFLGDGTNTFWETMGTNETMNAYEGYMVAIDKGVLSGGNNVWNNSVQALYIYFPSSETVGTLKRTDKEITIPAHPCDIDRPFANNPAKNHKTADANWNVIGVGSLANATQSVADFPYYEWDADDNTLTAETATKDVTTFNAGSAMMVQWTGTITWNNASVPTSVAARRIPADKKNYTAKVELLREGKMQDRAIVVLEEGADNDFVLNEDLYKEMNANHSNMYTFAGSYEAAVNKLAMTEEEVLVPLTVQTAAAGEYTFTMPVQIDCSAALVDYETGEEINLLTDDYEIELPKGTITGRFAIRLNARQMPTAIETISGAEEGDKVMKFIEAGNLYITRDGKTYDSTGHEVR